MRTSDAGSAAPPSARPRGRGHPDASGGARDRARPRPRTGQASHRARPAHRRRDAGGCHRAAGRCPTTRVAATARAPPARTQEAHPTVERHAARV